MWLLLETSGSQNEANAWTGFGLADIDLKKRAACFVVYLQGLLRPL